MNDGKWTQCEVTPRKLSGGHFKAPDTATVRAEENANTDRYKRRLLSMEQQLLDPLERVGEKARKQVHDSLRDVGDMSVDNEGKEQQFAEANADSTTLDQVREALKRIENGTFGKCLVDGQVIEEKRLEAIPWTPYCLSMSD